MVVPELVDGELVAPTTFFRLFLPDDVGSCFFSYYSLFMKSTVIRLSGLMPTFRKIKRCQKLATCYELKKESL